MINAIVILFSDYLKFSKNAEAQTKSGRQTIAKNTLDYRAYFRKLIQANFFYEEFNRFYFNNFIFAYDIRATAEFRVEEI